MHSAETSYVNHCGFLLLDKIYQVALYLWEEEQGKIVGIFFLTEEIFSYRQQALNVDILFPYKMSFWLLL